MPTPALHLPIAYQVEQRLRSLGHLSDLRDLGAFLFGSAGPDAAHYLDRPRADTHFWTTRDDVSGALTLLATHPQLHADALSPSERHFVAGFLSHLVADEQWTLVIWRPYFGRFSPYGGSEEGGALQRAFRDNLDAAAHAADPSVTDLAHTFAHHIPLRDDLLPFVDTASLDRYRVALLAQLNRGAPATDTPLHAVAADYVKLASAEEFTKRAVQEGVSLVADYLAGNPLRPPRGTQAPASQIVQA